MLITPADTAFSWCVRERADWRCERCGTRYEPPTKALHCSHYFGRGNWATRFAGINAFSHCYGCHSYFESNPLAFGKWVLDLYGQEKVDRLEALSNDLTLGKRARREKKEIAAHYRKENAYQKQQRSLGTLGRIEFCDWTCEH